MHQRSWLRAVHVTVYVAAESLSLSGTMFALCDRQYQQLYHAAPQVALLLVSLVYLSNKIFNSGQSYLCPTPLLGTQSHPKGFRGLVWSKLFFFSRVIQFKIRAKERLCSFLAVCFHGDTSAGANKEP